MEYIAKSCANCAHLDKHTKSGFVVDLACKGEPGKKWPLMVAHKDTRCGKGKAWWAPKEGSK